MKSRLISAFCAWLLSISTGCAAAQELAMPSVPITVEAHVRDPDSQAVAGATVRLALPRYRLGDKGQRIDSSTNADGVATVSGTAQQDYSVSVEKAGYYPTQGPWRGINDEKSFQKYAVGVQNIDLELRPIRNPINGIVKAVERTPLPVVEKPVGFDLEVGDWVAPYGKGRVADFVFRLDGRFNSPRDYDETFTLTFSKAQDGIMQVKYPMRTGPAFKFPYEAPLAGYESQHVWLLRWTVSGGSSGTSIDLNGETNYIFRVRTELDEKGNVRRALYGIITGDLVPVAGNSEIGRNVSFTYALNPDWTRNIEFDPAKVAVASR